MVNRAFAKRKQKTLTLDQPETENAKSIDPRRMLFASVIKQAYEDALTPPFVHEVYNGLPIVRENISRNRVIGWLMCRSDRNFEMYCSLIGWDFHQTSLIIKKRIADYDAEHIPQWQHDLSEWIALIKLSFSVLEAISLFIMISLPQARASIKKRKKNGH